MEDLVECGHGRLFGPGNAKLPIGNMLMMDRITEITSDGGEYGRGQIVAELDIKPGLWFFACHFDGDPVMPGCLGLDALWQLESATVRQVFDHLSSKRKIGYTTVLKFMQIMISKGLLVRDTSVRPQVYRVAKPREETQQGMLKSLIRQVFRNSPGELVLQALSLQQSTPQQIAEIRKRLDQMESNSER